MMRLLPLLLLSSVVVVVWGKTTDPPEYNTFPSDTNARIAIIGAGPAGVHMGYRLQQLGYENIIVYEKEGRIGGKTVTVWRDGVPHELGACYTHAGYRLFFETVEKLGLTGRPLPSREAFGSPFRPEDPVDLLTYAAEFVYFHYQISLTEEMILKQVHDYNTLWCDIFGSPTDRSARLPPLSDEKMEMMNMPFLDYIRTHQLYALHPLFLLSQTGQGYGYLETVPAFYGLRWNDPFIMDSLLAQFRGEESAQVYMVYEGMQALIDRMAEGFLNKIRLNEQITEILRNETKVAITSHKTGTNHNSATTEEFDFLIVAVGLHDARGWIDLRREEMEIYGNQSHLAAAMLLLAADGMPDRMPVSTWFNRLIQGNFYRLATVRHSSEIIFPEGGVEERRDTRVAFMFPDPSDSFETWAANLVPELTKDLIDQFNASNVEVYDRLVTKYFPHFSQQAINNRLPWDLQALQGKYLTWYAGSSAVFESINDVMKLNEDLLTTINIHN